jgi:endonuclease/exonuclease/phosphatase family metal-dependent hydrolase
VRVLTLNVQGFRDGIDPVAALIRSTDPDAVAINEAFRGETKRLAQRSGRVSVFGTTRPLRGFGNAILLREPPRNTRRLVFGRTRGYAARGAVAVASGGVAFVATHLGLSDEERVRHAMQLVTWLEPYEKVVLAGDLNEGPDEPAARYLTASYRDAFAEAGEGSGETYPASDPLHRIDYILCSRSLTPVRASVVAIAASDHRAVTAEIRPSGST